MATVSIEKYIDVFEHDFKRLVHVWEMIIRTLSLNHILKKMLQRTSSTAQGGGGRFINRKPIGEIGCCESRMAERIHWWTERWLMSPLFLSLSFSVFLWPSTYLPTDLSSIDLSTYLPIYLSIYLSSYLSIYLSIYKFENEAILRDFLSFWTWQHQKLSNSARLSQFLNLTTSKTKQFCETSSFFEVDDIKNERILRDFLQKWKVECTADGLVPMHFAIFFLAHLSKVLRLPRISDARSYEVLHLLRKIISANLKIWGSKMEPLWGNQRPDFLTSLMNMSLVLRRPREMHLCRYSSNVPCLPMFLKLLQNPHVLLTCDKVHNPFCLPRKTTSERPKVLQNPQFFCTFDFEMCFAPQRRALFRHLNFQKWSDTGVFCTFWLQYVLRTTTACTFSTSQLQKVVRPWCALYILTSKCSSCHNGVQFVISHLAKWLRTRRFSEPTFRPSGATNHCKNTMFRDFPTFSRICIFFLLTLSLLWSSLFYSSLLSDSSHLCFSSVHIVGSLTSKLPSGTYFKWLDVDLGTYQEDFASYLRTILQRIRNVLQVTWRRRYNISGTPFKLLQDVKTCQDRLASYLQKIFRRIRNIFKLLECNVTTYQECLESDLQNMLQRMRIHHAGPLSPPHVPAPCPQVLP